MPTIYPNQERAKAAILTLGICAGAIALTAGAQWWQANLIESGEMTMEIAQESDAIVGAAAVLYLICLVVCAVFFIRWFRRAYANLHRLERSILSFDEGWAAGAWFVPILNLGRPYTIMREVWRETQHAIPGKITETGGEQSAGLINWWWALWLIYNIGASIASRIGNDNNLDDILLRLRLGTYSDLVGIAAALVAIVLVRKTSAFELELLHAYPLNDPSEHLIT